jgi:hypothetical protein
MAGIITSQDIDLSSSITLYKLSFRCVIGQQYAILLQEEPLLVSDLINLLVCSPCQHVTSKTDHQFTTVAAITAVFQVKSLNKTY